MKVRQKKDCISIGYSSISVFDHFGMGRQGIFTLHLWPDTGRPQLVGSSLFLFASFIIVGTVSQNTDPNALRLRIELEQPPVPIYYDQPTRLGPSSTCCN